MERSLAFRDITSKKSGFKSTFSSSIPMEFNYKEQKLRRPKSLPLIREVFEVEEEFRKMELIG